MVHAARSGGSTAFRFLSVSAAETERVLCEKEDAVLSQKPKKNRLQGVEACLNGAHPAPDSDDSDATYTLVKNRLQGVEACPKAGEGTGPGGGGLAHRDPIRRCCGNGAHPAPDSDDSNDSNDSDDSDDSDGRLEARRGGCGGPGRRPVPRIGPAAPVPEQYRVTSARVAPPTGAAVAAKAFEPEGPEAFHGCGARTAGAGHPAPEKEAETSGRLAVGDREDHGGPGPDGPEFQGKSRCAGPPRATPRLVLESVPNYRISPVPTAPPRPPWGPCRPCAV